MRAKCLSGPLDGAGTAACRHDYFPHWAADACHEWPTRRVEPGSTDKLKHVLPGKGGLKARLQSGLAATRS
jgi:hypothetical protein